LKDYAIDGINSIKSYTDITHFTIAGPFFVSQRTHLERFLYKALFEQGWGTEYIPVTSCRLIRGRRSDKDSQRQKSESSPKKFAHFTYL
jgi:hypothetical protein